MDKFVPKLERIACPLCQSTKSKYWKTLKKWEVEQCQQCGFMFPNPMPSEETMIQAYALPETEYNYFFQADYLATQSVMNHAAPWQQENSKRYLDFLKQFKKDDNAIILDFGCSSGFFLEEAQKSNWKTIGIDPGNWGQPEKDSVLGIQRCSLFEANIEKNSIDVIFAASVIEHLTDPVRYLKKLNSFLKPQGIIYVVGLPNMHCHATLLGIDKWIGNHPPIHLGFYTPRTAKKILENTGFKDVKIKSHGLSETVLEFIFNRSNEKYDASYTNLLTESNFKGKILKGMRDFLNIFFNITKTGSVMEIIAKKKS
ncbi:MAG: class I SAM-dependent methyltransferase [Pseudomonadota bacterium]|nr:class I SAM-dependent methyltransferase [Pseudomonadota bacterium]